MENREYPETDVRERTRQKIAFFEGKAPSTVRHKSHAGAPSPAAAPTPSAAAKNAEHCLELVLLEQREQKQTEGRGCGLRCACDACQGFAARLKRRRVGADYL